MIKNARQYKITKTQAKKFEQALANFAHVKERDKITHPLLLKAQEDALDSQLKDLKAEILEYENLTRGKLQKFEIESIDELPRTLIAARIALGLGQRDLAERLGLKEQQIQRYEATDYASASLSRVIEVVNALNLKVHENIFFPNVTRTFDHLFSRLKNLGIEREFAFKRLIPRDIIALFKMGETENESALVTRSAAIIGKIFDLKPDLLLSNEPLCLKTTDVTVSFKLPQGRKKGFLTAYTFYAHYLALLTLEATKNIRQKKIHNDPIKVRNAIISKYGSIKFEYVLDYVWNLGIPVLPLNDSGAFNGACWRVERRNAIVIKQKSQYTSRWLFDLLHELYHAGQEPDKDKYEVIDGEDTDLESLEEQTASQFAGDVLLAGRAEELTEKCVEIARGKVEWLKNAVKQVATDEKVPVNFLANYIAYRLSLQNINWWGVANNLQVPGESPWEITRDYFLEKIDLSCLNKTDQRLIQLAMTASEDES